MANTAHRSGPLKQSNKSHKTGGHRSKGQIDNLNRGRVSSVSSGGVSKAKNHVQSKLVKRNKMKQLRTLKTEQVMEMKKALSSGAMPPQFVLVVPLVPLEHSIIERLEVLLQQDPHGDWKIEKNGHISSAQKFRRRFHFFQPNLDDNLAILDSAKVCDSIIFIVDDSVGLNGEKLIYSLSSQSIPSAPVFLLNPELEKDPKRKQANLKNVKKWIEQICPNASEKYFQLTNDQQAVQLLRHLGDQKRSKFNSLRSLRAHMFVENVDFVSQNGTEGTLKITGYLRGDKINVNRLVHIPGWGDFQLEKIEKLNDPRALTNKQRTDVNMSEIQEVLPSAQLQDDLVSENEPDMMDGEQTWPTAEELEEAEKSVKKKKVPKGTSDYQASWIVDENEGEEKEAAAVEDDDEMEDIDEDLEPQQDDSESEDSEDYEEDEEEMEETATNTEEGEYDTKHVTFADDQDAYAKIKAARQDEMFPDEVDTPLDIPAKTRFQKYRGLKSFRTSPWDPKENLPFDYSRIFQFENFQRTKKNVMANRDAEGEEYTVASGSYVTLHARNVACHLYQGWTENPTPLVVFSMLKHENKMSVVNLAVKRIHDPLNSDPIQSKERLIFHVGYRRFATQPTFSAHTNANKHKYERFWRSDEMVVMSMYAPIMYPPANVLVYRELASGRQTLVGSGNLLSVDPDRLVVKRAVLSGHPFKVSFSLKITFLRFQSNFCTFF